MDLKKSRLNVTFSLAFKVITVLLALWVKRALITVCGNEINGLNALFLSIIGFLSVAELGIGGAISFCMYKPIVEGDTKQVSALYALFKKLYLAVGAVIFAAGLALLPFLKHFAKDSDTLEVNVYLTFFLLLVSVVLTYLYSAKISLINAYKNNYITTAITQGGIVLQSLLQILLLYLTHSFVWYLVCRIISALVQLLATEIITRRHHADVLSTKGKIEPDTREKLTKSIGAMLMHKIGGALVNTVDNMVISVFIGVATLGEYSNYSTILTAMSGVIVLLFTSLTSIIGHLCVEQDQDSARKYYECFNLLNYIVGTVFFLGYFAIIDNIVSLMFAADLVVERSITYVITLNGFVQFMRHSTLIFRDATGTFFSDRYKPLFEGLLNLALSILFVHSMGVVGVIVATIVTNLLICHIVEPYVLYKHAFRASPRGFYVKNYAKMALFALALTLLAFCMQSVENELLQLLTNGMISVGISAVTLAAVLLTDRKTAKNIRLFFRKS